MFVGKQVFAILNHALCVLTEQSVTYTEGIKHYYGNMFDQIWSSSVQ